jgi:hypothetical protein
MVGMPDALSRGMMLKVLPLTALALGLSSGAAFADRGHGGDHRGGYEHRGDNRGSVVVRDHGNRGNTVVVRDHGNRGDGRVIVRGEPRYRNVVRRPIYVSRPVIHHRYYNYYRRPAVIFENYAPMTGYFWVSGSWSWNGFEWIWAPGHYEPDPSYYGYYDNY